MKNENPPVFLWPVASGDPPEDEADGHEPDPVADRQGAGDDRVTEFSAGDLQKACESGREIGQSTATWRSVTDEPYVVIGHQLTMPSVPGCVDEGEPSEGAFDEETAYFSALNAFHLYADGRPGKLYWRAKPYLEWNKAKPPKCRFYMRLLISEELVTF